jgi:outer membrane protein OmpA-like peptidoglycan-associated protein
MSLNLVDTVKSLFTNEIISKAASSLGETEGGISKAISGIVPLIIGSIVSKATSGEHGATNILQLAKDAAGSGILSNLGNLFTSNGDASYLSAGFDTLKGLLGDKLSSVLRSVSDYAGVKESSVSSLMSAAAPTALGVLGQHVQQTGLNTGSLVHTLSTEKDKIIAALPAGLGSVGGMLGLASVGSGIGKVSNATNNYAEDAKEKKDGGIKFILPLLLGILVVGLLIYLFKGCNEGMKDGEANKDSAQVQTDTVAAPDSPVSIKVKLPDGTELDAYKGGIEDQLVAFLMTDYAKLGEDSLKKRWFDFDNVNFKTGSAEITAESQHQIDNITAILKAFPKSKIKIGGYTDKTGDEAINKKVSGDRATSVKAALEKAGVGGQVIGADGYGSDYANFPATAPDNDRVKDRRVSVSVRL